MEKEKKLGQAELEIMQAVWAAGEPCSSSGLHALLKDSLGWKMPTLMTSLARLVEKGYLRCDKSGGMNMYSPLISQREYKTREGSSFLRRMYNNSLRELVSTLYHDDALEQEDIDELREFLNQLGNKSGRRYFWIS